MDERKIRLESLRDILLKVYGVYSSICDRRTFDVISTNAPGSTVQSLIWLDVSHGLLKPDTAWDPRKLYFYSDRIGVNWILMADEQSVYLLGPGITETISPMDLMERAGTYGLSPQMRRDFLELFSDAPIISMNRMCEHGLMLGCCLTGEKLTHGDILTWNPESRNGQKQASMDENQAAANYKLEQKIWKAVREGNRNYYRDLQISMMSAATGTISDGSFLRQEKNLIIVQTAMACRAAIEGGLPPEVAYAISDDYIQRIERSQTAAEISELSWQMLDTYICRVYQLKLREGISPQVLDCCAAISLHPEENPDIRTMAEKYGYSPYYFSKKFKSEVGMSVRDYAMQQKVEHAKILLTRDHQTVTDVCERLGFSNPSYFGTVFRKIVGMSPSEYKAGCDAQKRERTQKK